MFSLRKYLLNHLGPGLITGAADDDPSGIATYSQAGAQFGYAMLWSVFLTTPLMVGIQVVSARIGRVTGHGLAANLREYYPRPLLVFVVSLLLVANTINIAADIGAMGEALQLVVGGPAHGHALLFGVLAVLMQLFLPYSRLAPVLKWLTLSLFAYVLVLFIDQCRLAAAAQGHAAAAAQPGRRLPDAAGRRARHHDQPVPVLLAGVAGGGRPARDRRRRTAEGRAAAGAAPPAAHQDRHVGRHGVLQRHRVLHHAHHRGYAARSRHHQHPDIRAGRRGAAADRRQLGVPAVRARHHRHRPAGDPRARGLRRLRGRRSR